MLSSSALCLCVCVVCCFVCLLLCGVCGEFYGVVCVCVVWVCVCGVCEGWAKAKPKAHTPVANYPRGVAEKALPIHCPLTFIDRGHSPWKRANLPGSTFCSPRTRDTPGHYLHKQPLRIVWVCVCGVIVFVCVCVCVCVSVCRRPHDHAPGPHMRL